MRRADACRRAGTEAAGACASRACRSAATRGPARTPSRSPTTARTCAGRAARFTTSFRKSPSSSGQAVVRAVGHEADAAVDVPAEDEDAALRARDRRAHGREIGGAVDEKSEALRAFDAPAVAAGHEQACAVCCIRVSVCPWLFVGACARAGPRAHGKSCAASLGARTVLVPAVTP